MTEHPVLKVAKREVSITQRRKTRTGLSYVNLPVDHVVYLIQQAERAFKNAQDLEDMDRQIFSEQKRITELEKNLNIANKSWKKLLAENERYKRALEELRKYSLNVSVEREEDGSIIPDNEAQLIYDITNKALKGDVNA